MLDVSVQRTIRAELEGIIELGNEEEELYSIFGLEVTDIAAGHDTAYELWCDVTTTGGDDAFILNGINSFFRMIQFPYIAIEIDDWDDTALIICKKLM